MHASSTLIKNIVKKRTPIFTVIFTFVAKCEPKPEPNPESFFFYFGPTLPIFAAKNISSKIGS